MCAAPDRLPEETYRQVFEELTGLSPVVQALPPSAALVELKGALRYHGTDTRRLGEMLRVRSSPASGSTSVSASARRSPSRPPAPPRFWSRAGSSPSRPARPRTGLPRCRSKPCTASAPARPTPSTSTAFTLLACSPPSHRPWCSACSAAKPAARQRTGPAESTRASSLLAPCPPPQPFAFDRHTLDGATVRATLLDLAVQLARLLRRRGQAARALTFTLRFAGGTSRTKTRRLTEPSAHDDDLRTLAYRLMDAAGLQRGRLTGIALKGEDLVDADQVAQQISLDTAREARLVAEAAMDRIRDKFGPGVIGPAATRRAS